MKASVRDKEILAAIAPLELVAYLRSTGWCQVKEKPDCWAAWVRDEDFEVVVPLARDLGDFVLRMADALRTLEAVEDRSQLEILNDLRTASADILRFRFTDAEVSDGTIRIEEGAQIVQQARELMMAGACATLQRRAVFQTRKPTQAVEYLKKVRLGQTERGSYLVTVISPVAIGLEGGLLFEVEEPYARRVTTTLSRALAAAKRAAGSAVTTGRVDEFLASVNEGVSANLCAAIQGLASGGETDRGVEISFSWSRSRPIGPEVPNRVAFPPDIMPVLEEAARLFRETAARDEFELRGPVVKLERDEGAPTGRVTIQGIIDEHFRKVFMELNEVEYHKAVQAHDNQQTVFCIGSLVREGRAFSLKNPHGLEIELDA